MSDKKKSIDEIINDPKIVTKKGDVVLVNGGNEYMAGNDTVTTADLKKVMAYDKEYLKNTVNHATDVAEAILRNDDNVQKVIHTSGFQGKHDGASIAVDRVKEFKSPVNNEPIRKTKITVATKSNAGVSKKDIKTLEDKMTQIFVNN